MCACQSVKEEYRKIDSKGGRDAWIALYVSVCSVGGKSRLKRYSENRLVPIELTASPDHHT